MFGGGAGPAGAGRDATENARDSVGRRIYAFWLCRLRFSMRRGLDDEFNQKESRAGRRIRPSRLLCTSHSMKDFNHSFVVFSTPFLSCRDWPPSWPTRK